MWYAEEHQSGEREPNERLLAAAGVEQSVEHRLAVLVVETDERRQRRVRHPAVLCGVRDGRGIHGGGKSGDGSTGARAAVAHERQRAGLHRTRAACDTRDRDVAVEALRARDQGVGDRLDGERLRIRGGAEQTDRVGADRPERARRAGFTG